MPNIYINDESRAKLDALCKAEKRSIADEMDLVIDGRFKELGLPDVTKPSLDDSPNSNNPESSCQGENHAA